jgi:hypothetical protein
LKNSLASEDAAVVERTFRDRVGLIAPDAYGEKSKSQSADGAGEASPPLQSNKSDPNMASADPNQLACEAQKSHDCTAGGRASKDVIDFGLVKLRRCRNKEHLRFIPTQSCTVCGRQPCEAHHLRFTEPRALGPQGLR